MVEGAARLLARRGLDATSFPEVLAATGASRGSVYLRFPGGKDELVLSAVDASGRYLLAARFATTLIAATEGAVIVARAGRSVEPFERVARQMQDESRRLLALRAAR